MENHEKFENSGSPSSFPSFVFPHPGYKDIIDVERDAPGIVVVEMGEGPVLHLS